MLSSDPPPANARDQVVVLIPAWQPDERLRSLLSKLSTFEFAALIVVDDGSGKAFDPLFQDAQRIPHVELLRRQQNGGKGSALKIGIDFIRREMPHVHGAVTADADGQHAVHDILRVASALLEARGSMVLGARRFTGAVPLRCRLGNWITRKAFRVLTGVKLTDTQSGLRGFPRSLFEEVVRLAGTRYEYEMVVLTHLCRAGRPPIEIPIETLYLDGNASSHFNPVIDSVRVLLALIRCVLSR